MNWERAQMFRSLSLLQASGIRLDYSLDLVGRLREGQAMFSSYHRAVLDLGEKSGNLDRSLAYLARHEEDSSHLRQKIAAELTYPVLVLGSMLALVLLLAPSLRLPLWPFALIAICLAGLWMARGRLPVPGPWKKFRKTRATAQFLSCWGNLLEQGIPMLTSLQLSAHASQEGECSRAITRIQAGLRAGQELPACFRESGYFTPLVEATIVAGLECGSLDQLRRPLVNLYEVELEANLRALVSLLNPICMVLVGGLLMVFLGCSVTPLLKLAAQL